jgi:hypothetical protein
MDLENENPQLFKNSSPYRTPSKIIIGTKDHLQPKDPLENLPSVEFKFLEVSMLFFEFSANLKRKPTEVTCIISCEGIHHEVRSCISSKQGKYYFPKQVQRYILTQFSDSKLNMDFSEATGEYIGAACFDFDMASLISQRQTISVKCSTETKIGEVTFLPQTQEEVSVQSCLHSLS